MDEGPVVTLAFTPTPLEVRCDVPGCGAILASHNPYFYRGDGIRKCVPHRQAEWSPDTTPLQPVPRLHERKGVVNRQMEEKVANALPVRMVCECERPVPMRDDEEDDHCVLCSKRLRVMA